MIHVSTLPEVEQKSVLKDIKVSLHYFNVLLYKAAPEFKTGNFYGPFVIK
jgi:hypothetical protein